MQLHFGILTVSDRSAHGERPDLSGPALVELVTTQGWTVARTDIIAEDLVALREVLSAWVDGGEVDIILTTGGTGFATRDVNPEATRAVIESEAPGSGRGHARGKPESHAACHALPGNGGNSWQSAHHQPAGQPQSRSGKFAGGCACPGPCG